MRLRRLHTGSLRLRLCLRLGLRLRLRDLPRDHAVRTRTRNRDGRQRLLALRLGSLLLLLLRCRRADRHLLVLRRRRAELLGSDTGLLRRGAHLTLLRLGRGHGLRKLLMLLGRGHWLLTLRPLLLLRHHRGTLLPLPLPLRRRPGPHTRHARAHHPVRRHAVRAHAVRHVPRRRAAAHRHSAWGEVGVPIRRVPVRPWPGPMARRALALASVRGVPIRHWPRGVSHRRAHLHLRPHIRGHSLPMPVRRGRRGRPAVLRVRWLARERARLLCLLAWCGHGGCTAGRWGREAAGNGRHRAVRRTLRLRLRGVCRRARL